MTKEINSAETELRATVQDAPPWEFDYLRFLYKGGASANIKIPTSAMSERFGSPHLERLPLVLKIKDVIDARFAFLRDSLSLHG
jgi:hypothetical protein